MGTIAGRVQMAERGVNMIRARDLKAAMDISVFLQIMLYFFGLLPAIAASLKNPSMPPESSSLYLDAKKQVSGGPKYAEQHSKDALAGNPLIVVSCLHQILTGNLLHLALERKRLTIAGLLTAFSSCFCFTAVAWLLPVKTLAAADEVRSGNVVAYANLKTLIENETNQEKDAKCAFLACGAFCTYLNLKSILSKAAPAYVYGLLATMGLINYWRDSRRKR